MFAQPDGESAIHSYSAESPPGEDSTRSSDTGVPVSRARDYNGEVTSITDRLRHRRGPVLTEADEPADLPKARHRSPWSDDRPSPRCVWRDYRAGARHYGEGALAIQAAYWAVAFIPCTLNMAFAAGHMFTERAAYFWGPVAFGLLVMLIVHFTH